MSTLTARRSFGIARRVVRETRARDVRTFAAAVAYYAFVSLVPLLALSLIAAAAAGGAALEAAVADLAGRYLLPTGRDLVVEALRGTRGRGSATALGLAALVWSTLRLFRGVNSAFVRVYGTDPGSGLAEFRDAVVALGSVAVGGLAVAVGAGTLGTLAGRSVLAAVVPFLSIPVLAAAFFPLYYVLPDTDVSLREALPGTVFAAVGWSLLGTAFGAYAAYAGGSGAVAVYGALGGLVLLVTWFYLAGHVLLVGAVVNAVLAGRLDTDRQVQQPRGRDDATMGAEGSDDRDDRDADETADGSPSTGPERTGGAAGAGGDPDAAAGAGGGTDADRDATGGRDAADRGPAAPGGRRDTERAAGGGTAADEPGSEDVADLEERVATLRDELDAFREDVDRRTLHRDEIKADLKQYVRRRMRRGHARGWGPYLVLLYGTVMTLGAFHFLEGVWAILAMIVLFLSTLGLYTLFVLVGMGLSLLGTPRRAYERVREFRR